MVQWVFVNGMGWSSVVAGLHCTDEGQQPETSIWVSAVCRDDEIAFMHIQGICKWSLKRVMSNRIRHYVTCACVRACLSVRLESMYLYVSMHTQAYMHVLCV